MLMLSGFFLGVGGAIFSVGVTSVPKYFSKDKVGLANGIYGLGTDVTPTENIAPPTPKKNPDNINIPGVCACPKKKIGSKDKVGLANGIYGMGNIGTAVSSFLAPPIAGIIGRYCRTDVTHTINSISKPYFIF
jgi:nitrate/nitrite transporter NarK